MPKIYCVDERGIIEEPYQTPDNMSRKKGFVIKVQEMYRWKNLPVAKVLFLDCQQHAEKFRNDLPAVQTLKSYFSVERIVADPQVSCDMLMILIIQLRNSLYNDNSLSYRSTCELYRGGG